MNDLQNKGGQRMFKKTLTIVLGAILERALRRKANELGLTPDELAIKLILIIANVETKMPE